MSEREIQLIGDRMSEKILEHARAEIKIFCNVDNELCSWKASISNPRDCRECPKSLLTESKK